jgi:hypothetical protein
MRRLIVEVEDITAKPSSFRFEIQPSTGVGRRAKTPSQLTFIGRSRNCFGIRHGTVDAGDIGGMISTHLLPKSLTSVRWLCR